MILDSVFIQNFYCSLYCTIFMYEVFDHLCAYVKLVYCVTVDCLQSDLFL